MARFTGKLRGNKADWLIRQRWIAGCCVIIATFVTSVILHITIRAGELYILALCLFLLNLFYKILLRLILQGKISILNEQSLIILQILLDMVLLTMLLHFSGGVENPFIIYYIFHLMIASILLPRKISYFLTTFMLLLVGSLASSEYLGIIHHYSLTGFLTNGFYNNTEYLAGTGFVFLTTSYVVVYMTSAVSAKLREAEKAYRLANKKLEEKDKIKDEYVYRLSHDIKGHIAAIKSSLDASLIQQDPEKIKKFSRNGLLRAELLTDFLHSLLRITRLRLNRESEQNLFSLDESILKVIGFYRTQANEKEIEIITNLRNNDKRFSGNQVSIEEALSNLIQNAVKYTGAKGKITVKTYIRKSYFIIEVEDTGIGIPEDELHGIFKEFYRAKNARNQQKEGDGLGLAITKQIIENHKGKINVKSKENEGTRFTVKLPVAD